MGSKSSPPPPPDPGATAAAQAQANSAAAIKTNELNAINQVGPYGSLTYTQNGTWADGTPKLTATQALSPEEQNLYNLDTSTQGVLGQTGLDQAKKIQDILSTPFDINTATNDQQTELTRKLLDPTWDRSYQALQTQLYNSGARPGSDAYDNAMRQFYLQKDDAYNSGLLASRGQAEQEALTNRNQPLNEILALLRGSSVQQPNFVNTPTANIAAPNYEGDAYNSYAGQQANYQTKVGQQNALMGGLFGLAAAPLGGWAMGMGKAGKSSFG